MTDSGTTFFHSTCIIRGKVCKLVIDGGCCENMVAEKAVQKLALDTEKHPTTYRLEWLNKGNEVIISKCCLINFSIGTKYKDKTWCDMVAMDAYHLLLRRPWQYNQNVHHDGRKNTYSFLVDNVKVTLLPNPKDVHNSPKEVGQTLLAKREFIREMPNIDQVSPFYGKECNPTEIVPEVVTGFLEEFTDVFPKDLSEELLPLHDIQHQINLVPGSTLSNRPHYHVSPKLDFGPIMKDMSTRARQGFGWHNGFLFKGTQFCIPKGSLRLKIIKECHNEGHRERDKTLQLVAEQFYWPSMRREVDKLAKSCQICQVSKESATNAGVYLPLPIDHGQM
jgi:hypothetical protein